MLKTIIDNIILLIGGGATLTGGILAWRNRKRTERQQDVKIELDEVQKTQIIQGTTSQVEKDFEGRIEGFRTDLVAVRQELERERGLSTEWRNRVMLLEEFFFTRHMPWDRKMTLTARDQGWEIEDPPSILDYLKEVGGRADGS